MEDWSTLKETLPWGQMPLLDIGDECLAQSLAICRYLGRKFNLIGATDWESAKCDEYVDAMSDIFLEWAKYFIEQDPEKKKKLQDEFQQNQLPKYLSKLNAIAENSVSKWLIGKDMTWCDIFIADKLDRLQQSEGKDILESYPHLKEFKNAVFATPNIKAYVEQRPDSDY